MGGQAAFRFVHGAFASHSMRLGAVAVVALATANCGSPQKVSSGGRGGIDPKYGVAASPRVIPDGQPIPKGGGREMVGKPYTVAGRTYVPSESKASREGLASWYGEAFHGRLTANGEIFDRASIAAAHATMPLPSYARVTNLSNRRSMIVRVNDRGPYHANRIIDVSEAAADALGFHRAGTARVRVDYIGRASVNGSDDRKLLATLRDDGAPAGVPGRSAPVMVASADLGAPRPVLSHSAQILQASAAGRPSVPAAPIRLASATADLPIPQAAPPPAVGSDEEDDDARASLAPVRPKAAREPAPPIRLASAAAELPIPHSARPHSAKVSHDEEGAAARAKPARVEDRREREPAPPIRLASVPKNASAPVQAPGLARERASAAPLPPGRPVELAAKPGSPRLTGSTPSARTAPAVISAKLDPPRR